MRGGHLRVNKWLVGTTPTFELDGDNRLQVEGLTRINGDLQVTGSISGSVTSTGSFGMVRVGDNGFNLELRTKSGNMSLVIRTHFLMKNSSFRKL